MKLIKDKLWIGYIGFAWGINLYCVLLVLEGTFTWSPFSWINLIFAVFFPFCYYCEIKEYKKKVKKETDEKSM